MLPDLDRRIEQLDNVLDGAVKQTTRDGVTTVYDLDFAAKRAKSLRRRHPLGTRGRRTLYSQPFAVTEAAEE